MGKKRRLVLSLALVLAMAAGLWLGRLFLPQAGPEKPLEIGGFYLPEAKKIVDFALLADDGETFTPASFKGRWSFIYFGYTFCPDACPMTLGQLKVFAKQLSEEGIDEKMDYFLISVDPKRDTPARLAEYTAFFGPNFHGVTGEEQELDKLAKQLGVYFSVPQSPQDPENYLVDHSSTVTLINPNGDFQAVLTAPHDPQKMITDFKAIRSRFERAN